MEAATRRSSAAGESDHPAVEATAFDPFGTDEASPRRAPSAAANAASSGAFNLDFSLGPSGLDPREGPGESQAAFTLMDDSGADGSRGASTSMAGLGMRSSSVGKLRAHAQAQGAPGRVTPPLDSGGGSSGSGLRAGVYDGAGASAGGAVGHASRDAPPGLRYYGRAGGRDDCGAQTRAWFVGLALAVASLFVALVARLRECCGGRTFRLRGRRLREVRLLAEGGFSFVHLVSNPADAGGDMPGMVMAGGCGGGGGGMYALKRMLIQDAEQLRAAEWEVEVHRALGAASDHLLELVDADFVDVRADRSTAAVSEARLLFPYFENGSVQDVLARLAPLGRGMGEATALATIAQVCLGVRQFHRHDPPWAHRDIKPANILQGAGGRVVLTDFGSTAPARVEIADRRAALALQEQAAQFW